MRCLTNLVWIQLSGALSVHITRLWWGMGVEMDGIVIAGGLSSRRCIHCWLYDAALLVILVLCVMICSSCDSVVGSWTNHGVWIRSVSWECKKCHKQKLGQQLKSHWTRVGVLAYLFKFHSLFLFRESLKFVNAPTASTAHSSSGRHQCSYPPCLLSIDESPMAILLLRQSYFDPITQQSPAQPSGAQFTE